MTLRRRGEHSYWSNEVPIIDVYEALELLRPQWNDAFGDRTRYLAMDLSVPELHIEWFRDGDSGGASSGTHYLEIAPEVVAQLQKENWVRPYMEKGHGWARPNADVLVISDHAKFVLEEYLNRTRDEVRGLLIPGEHSKFSGIFEPAGRGRKSRFGGRLYFDFVTPMREKVRVFPDIKEVVKLEPEKV